MPRRLRRLSRSGRPAGAGARRARRPAARDRRAAGRARRVAGPDRPDRRTARGGDDRARRQVREAARRLSLGARGAQARRRPPGRAGARAVGRRGEHVLRGGGRAARAGRRRPRPGRLRLARLGGEDPRLPGRAGAWDPVPRHLPRHARRRLGVRAARRRARGRELDRDGSRDAVPGDRPAAGAEGDRGSRRHDAARRAGGRARRRHADARRLRRGRHPRAPPPPLRGQQPVPRPADRGRARRLGDVPGRASRRDRRAPRASVVRGEPVPPGVQVAADEAGAALPRVRRRRAGSALRAPRRRCATSCSRSDRRDATTEACDCRSSAGSSPIPQPSLLPIAAIGVADDLWSGEERGFRAHLGAGATTGVLKLVGIPAYALWRTRSLSGAILVGLCRPTCSTSSTRSPAGR